MGIPLLAGRELSESRPLDRDTTSLIPTPEEQKAFAARGINIIVNERGARDLGFANPADIVGKQFPMGLVEPEYRRCR
jgi:putative ABC transport system permease protein